MKLTTGYKKPIASSGTDALELSSNNNYLLLAGGGHKALSELVSPADLTTELSNYVTIGSNQTITGVKTFSLIINADITGNAATATNVAWSGVTNKPTSFPANGGNADYATAAGNAGTLSGHTAADFVLKTTHDVYESVIADALNDLDSRKADIADIPTSLPANGGNADYATSAGSVDWSGVTNRPSSFTPSSHTHTTSEITNFPTIGNGALHIKVNGTELTPEGGLFTANKGGNSTIDIAVPTAESIEQSTLNKLGGKVVLKNDFTTELAKEMAEVTSGKHPNKILVFNFTNPASTAKLECNPDILSVNYINVGDYYRLNIAGSFVLNGFNFYEQKLQDNYNPVLYSVISGTINNVELSAKKTGMLYFRLSDQQVSPNGAYGPVMFELSVFVETLSTDYNEGIYGELNITQFYS